MKISIPTYFLILSLVILFSCEIKPKEIHYGEDHCNYCSMTVVDKSHAAQFVTTKGKPYIFDATECLLMEIQKEGNALELKYILVTDYGNPGKLIDAQTAYFLISPNIPSPMGGNLSAFSSKSLIEETLETKSGEILTWEQLKSRYNN